MSASPTPTTTGVLGVPQTIVLRVAVQKEILRRIAERGMKLAHKEDTLFVDIFQHLLDEIERL